MKGVDLHLRVRPSFWSEYAPRPDAIPPTTRSGTNLEIVLGKTSDCKVATHPKIQIVNRIPTNAARMFQKRLTSALPSPELVSVRKIRPMKNNANAERRMESEYCRSPRGSLISQIRPRSIDNPTSAPAIRRVASDSLESRPISINLFSSQCFAHQR
jgi:hypothetical protein